jgi:heptose I phosphotransferase
MRAHPWAARVSVQLPDELRAALGPGDPFDAVMTLPGAVYRRGPARETLRVELAGRALFLKRHRGVGWGEIAKNLASGRLPVTGAGPEVRALERLPWLGVRVPALAGRGSRGWSPAHRESFVLMQALDGMTSLEDLCRDWGTTAADRARVALKRALLAELARIARTLHEHGANHRDFYLCHFLVADPPAPGSPVHLIDLHRVQWRTRTPLRWRAKDLGGLYFSALDAGLTGRDVLRFVRAYRAAPLRETLHADRALWRRSARVASALYRKAHGRPPRLPILPP